MYAYIYAPYLRKGGNRLLTAVETSIGVYGLGGRINRLSGFLTLDGIVREERKRKTATIVVVGDDATFLEVVYRLVGSRVVVGYIPLATGPMQTLLGLPVGEGSVAMLAARRVETLDVGQVNSKFFLDFFALTSPMRVRITLPSSVLASRVPMHVEISNFSDHPRDGVMRLFLERRAGLWKEPEISSLPIECCLIEVQSRVRGMVDGYLPVDPPFDMGVIPDGIRLIVGKEKTWYTDDVSK